MTAARTLLLTVGHGAAGEDDFRRLLQAAEVAAVVDVRIGPGSRKHPHFGKARLQEWLPAAGIAYRWEQRLGGFRKLPADSPDTALRNESFRAYAAYMRTPDFAAALAGVLAEAAVRRTAVMCSETVWWRCHRRLIADHALLIEGAQPVHLMPPGRTTPHQPTAGVRVAGDELVYDVAPG
ncbi:DUF488 domain-containing protein [Arthrobacter sp. I2-34]|uniref:DUF488 domain-containing protein n=1 Tax=Arthrobacter hankyongi TaxID=2904801 RepID=A0ABS9LB90_9MICC|nr:DUF488 domain-containing protein [Arthrobacter hankyongi]MCG2623935.1 DUF488 domain-containing protein [Arthrobacter hankyongi]